ncbi:hypothetical protein NAS2_1047 [Conexivisphaera calida]|uniref:Uncharacterized protein n=1 Tax=Conexivisphaera calida TaxID=1874277 RepID=A0A4P2VCU6_9ARCH|nr:hypothetical protein NAS2_1047 [Conexivisphaera calida]
MIMKPLVKALMYSASKSKDNIMMAVATGSLDNGIFIVDPSTVYEFELGMMPARGAERIIPLNLDAPHQGHARGCLPG